MSYLTQEEIGDGYFAGGKLEHVEAGSAYGKSVMESFAPTSFDSFQPGYEGGGLGVSFGDIFGGLIGGVKKLFGSNTDSNSAQQMQMALMQAQQQAQAQRSTDMVTYGLLGAAVAGALVYFAIKNKR